jgi:hypothetical protein
MALEHGQLVFLAGLTGAETSKLRSILKEHVDKHSDEERNTAIHRRNYETAEAILYEVEDALALANEDEAERA